MALGKRDSPIAEMPPDKPPETGVFLKGRCDDRFALAEGEGSGSQQLVQRRAGEKVKGGKGANGFPDRLRTGRSPSRQNMTGEPGLIFKRQKMMSPPHMAAVW